MERLGSTGSGRRLARSRRGPGGDLLPTFIGELMTAGKPRILTLRLKARWWNEVDLGTKCHADIAVNLANKKKNVS